MRALVREVIGVLLAFMSYHGGAAVEAFVTVLARVHLNALVTIRDVVA